MRSFASRRTFLQGTVALALAPAGAALAARAVASEHAALLAKAIPERASEAIPDEAFWNSVRQEFTFPETTLPMNAGNLCPAFREIAEEVCRLTAQLDLDVSFEARKVFQSRLEGSRQAVAKHLGVRDPQDIALVRNASEANCVVNVGLMGLGPGKRVLLWEENHPTNREAWRIRARRLGFAIDWVTDLRQLRSEEALVEKFRAKLTPDTLVLTFSEISNISGLKLPAKALCTMAHAQAEAWGTEILVHVDGAQSWGALNLNLTEMGCDSFAGSAHKWFMGPREVGLLFVKKKWAKHIVPIICGYDGHLRVDEQLKESALRFETLGQRDDAAIAPMADTVRLHHWIGPQRIAERISSLAERLKAGLREKVEFVTPTEPGLSHGIVVIKLASEAQAAAAAHRLYERFGIAGAPIHDHRTGIFGLRLCPHVYNLEAHVDQAIQAVLLSIA